MIIGVPKEIKAGEARVAIVASGVAGFRADGHRVVLHDGLTHWEELEDRQGCRICARYPGGWRSPESEWVEIQDRAIDALIRLEGALRKPISEISV